MSRFASRFAALLFGILIASLAARADATVVLPWYDGVLNPQIGQDYPCPPASPILETRVAGYSGYTYRPPQQSTSIPFAQLPAVGELFYAKLVLSHPGNPCAGSAIGIELLLPAGVTTAISADNPLFCFARVPPNSQHANYLLYNLANDSGYGCPQTLPNGLEGLALYAPHGGVGGGSWGMAAGFYLEFMVPLRSSVPQNGTNQISFRVNPDIGVVGYTNIPLYVNSDVIFRASSEDQNLTLDLCAIAPLAQGC
jgi:hypothetical protein